MGVERLFMNEHLILFYFVDDIVVLFQIKDAKKLDEFQTKIFEVYKICSLRPLQWCLGNFVISDQPSHRLCLGQSFYIDKIIAKYNITMKSKHPGAQLLPEELVKSLT